MEKTIEMNAAIPDPGENLSFEEVAMGLLLETGVAPTTVSREEFTRALVTSDFPRPLADVVNKSLHQ